MQFRIKSEIFLFLVFFATTFFLFPYSSSSSFNSLSGNILTPSAYTSNEGEIKAVYSKISPLNKINFIASPYDWLEASFYYNDINVRRYFPGSKQSYKDKGFSFKLRLKDEGIYPAISIGFEDIGGTSIFKSEYIVATKSINQTEISLGIGFGALGSRSLIKNFFREGDRSKWDFSTGGEFNFNDSFKGDASIFGAISYEFKAFKNSKLILEYDSDNYTQYYDLLPGYERYAPRSRYNIGAKIPISKNFTIGIAHVKGNELALSLEGKISISKKKNNYPKFSNTKAYKSEYISILNDLRKVGVFLQRANIDHENKKIELVYAQSSFHDQDILTKKIMNYLRKNYGENSYEIVLNAINGAYDLSSFRYRSYSEKVTYEKFNNINYFFNPKIKFPIINHSIGPNFTSHIGSPSGFFFGGIEGTLNTEIAFNRNLQLNSAFAFPIYDNYKDLEYNSNPTSLYPVRTDIQEYLKDGRIGFNEFTLNYYSKIFDQDYFQISVGHFEQMYSGIHFEYLKRKFDSPFSYGFEVSKVYQRDYSKEFSKFRDFNTTTGHANFYAYEQRNKILFHFSAGKYLAGDLGFTMDVSRYFSNGARLGVFFSKTNVEAEQFGEGSFDKGVYVKYPLFIFNSNRNSRSFNKFLFRPITRDGAAKISFPRKLFDLTRDSQKIEILENS